MAWKKNLCRHYSISNKKSYSIIDVAKLFKTNSFYWDSDREEVDNRPNWIDQNVSTDSDDFYIKYWRNDWKTIVKSILDDVVAKGYDGIVFGSGENYSKYPMIE